MQVRKGRFLWLPLASKGMHSIGGHPLLGKKRIHGDHLVEYWNDLKSALRKRHIPSYYERELMDKLQRLRQGKGV